MPKYGVFLLWKKQDLVILAFIMKVAGKIVLV